MGVPLSAPQAQGSPAPAPSGMGQLLGAQQNQASADMQRQLDSASRRFRDLTVEINALASNYPMASEDFRSVLTGLQQAMMKVTRHIASQQPANAAAA